MDKVKSPSLVCWDSRQHQNIPVGRKSKTSVPVLFNIPHKAAIVELIPVKGDFGARLP